MEYLGRTLTPDSPQVGDRFEMNGQLREVVEIVPIGLDDLGRPCSLVVSRVVPDISQIPAPARFSLRCLAAIAGVKL